MDDVLVGIVRQANRKVWGAGIDMSALEYDSTTKRLLNNPKNMIFEAKLRELSVDKCGTSRHCEAGRLVATGGRH